MDCYEIWFDLAPGEKDLDVCDAIHAWLGHLQEQDKIAGYRLTRRKLGFSPPGLGEFHLTIEARGLAHLDEAFKVAAQRAGESQELHSNVYRRIVNFQSALYRDFPDPERVR